MMQMRERFHKELSTLPDDTVSFDVTPAAQWFLRDDEKLEYDIADFPSLLPVYPNMWMEFTLPSVVRSGLDGTVHKRVGRETTNGCMMSVIEFSEDEAMEASKDKTEFLASALQVATGIRAQRDIESFSTVMPRSTGEPRWMALFQVFLSNKNACYPVETTVFLLDEFGKYDHSMAVSYPEHMVMIEGVSDKQFANKIVLSWDKTGMDSVNDLIHTFILPFHFCLSLLHCRNVNVIDKPPAPTSILKRREKNGIPFIQYKMLDVLPLRTVNKQKGEPQPSEPKAMHFVRGHFKSFEDKGLFGKYKGVYWWNNQVRGSVANGIVDKDYRVRNA